jgi:hypothetical protein
MFLSRTGKKSMEKRELIIMDIKINSPKDRMGGKFEKISTKNPAPTTIVLNRMTDPLLKTVFVRAFLLSEQDF